MSDVQYDVPENVVKLYYKRRKQLQESKAYYRKYITNPHRPLTEGPPFDPQLFRYAALDMYAHEHFKGNPKTFGLFSGLVLFPLGLLIFLKYKRDADTEALYRSGTVAYKDRPYRLLY